MVLDIARPKNKQSTIWPGMRGRDAARKLNLKVNILQVFTIHFSEIQFIVEQKCKEWDEFAQEDHTYRLTPEEKKRYQGKWYLTLNKAGKNGPMKLRSDFRAAVCEKSSTPRITGTSWRAYPSRTIQSMASLFKHIVVGQVWMELELSS